MKENKKLVFTNSEEEKIYNRGISAGYFNVHIEDISDFEESEKNFYNLGIAKGEQKLKNQEPSLEFINARYSYIITLGYWTAKGEIDTSSKSLELDEKAYYKLGHKKALEELKKEQGMSIDDYLESKRQKQRKIEIVND